jgi:hypothetical protein
VKRQSKARSYVTFPAPGRNLQRGRPYYNANGRGASLAATVAALGLLAGACAATVPLPARAASVEANECRGALPAEEEARSLESFRVLAVRSTFHQNACNGACTVWGVYLVVRPQGRVDPERFAQMLRCHNLRVLDGEVDASRIPNDPYGLRDSWLEMDVRLDPGNYLVTLVGDHVSDTLRILQRAKAYAAAHGTGTLEPSRLVDRARRRRRTRRPARTQIGRLFQREWYRKPIFRELGAFRAPWGEA